MWQQSPVKKLWARAFTGALVLAGSPLFSAPPNTWSRIDISAPVEGFLVDPQESDVLYAPSIEEEAILFRSTDGGRQWEELGVVPDLYDSLMQFVISPNDPETMYIAAQEYGGSSGDYYYLIRSLDRGVTWETIFDTDDGRFEIAISTTDPLRLYRITHPDWEDLDVFSRSTNGGRKWTGLHEFPCDVTAMAVVQADTGTDVVLVGTDCGLYRTTDEGMTWALASEGLPSSGKNLEMRELRVHPTNRGVVYMGTRAGVFVSDDAGLTWRSRRSGLGARAVIHISICRQDSDVLYAATADGAIFRSRNGGESWSERQLGGGRSAPISGLQANPRDPNVVYASIGQRVLVKSVDGGLSWHLASSGLPWGCIRDLLLDPDNPRRLYALTCSGVFKSLDGGQSWAPANRGLDTPGHATLIAMDPVEPSRLVVFIRKVGLFESVNGAKEWHLISADLADKQNPVCLVIHPRDPSIIYAGMNMDERPQVFRSTDGGRTWRSHHGEIAPADWTYLLQLVPDPTSLSRVYAVTSRAIYKTADEPLGWELFRFDLYLPMAMVVDPVEPRRVYVVDQNLGVQHSGDSGLTWESINHGLGNFGYKDTLTIDPIDGRSLYLATDLGAYHFEFERSVTP